MNEKEIINQVVAAILLTRGRDRVVWQLVEMRGGSVFPRGTRFFRVFSRSLLHTQCRWIDRVHWLDGRCVVVGMEDLLKVHVSAINYWLRDPHGLV
jgi:hypothetical protein